MADQLVLEPLDAGHDDRDALAYLFYEEAPRKSRRMLDMAHRTVNRLTRSITPTPHNFVSRAKWGARAPRSGYLALTATGGVAEHYEGPAMGTFTHASCAGKVRAVQNYHMDSRGWIDIAYSYVVCPHGYIYEGRGLRRRTAANGTNSGNDAFYAVCYLGGVGDPLTDPARRAYDHVILWLRRYGAAGKGVKPHSFFKPTACPGDPLRAHAKSRDGATFADPFAPAPVKPPPAAHPAFPLKKGHWFGPESRDVRNHSGCCSESDRRGLKMWQTQMRNRGWKKVRITGQFDEWTAAAVAAFNKEKGIHSNPPGTIGETTWNRAWTEPVTVSHPVFGAVDL